MSILLSFLLSHAGIFLGGLLGLGGVAYGAWHQQKAKVTTAEAATQVAVAQLKVAQAGQQVAQMSADVAQASASAAEGAAAAVKQADAIPDADLDAEGAKLGIVRKE